MACGALLGRRAAQREASGCSIVLSHKNTQATTSVIGRKIRQSMAIAEDIRRAFETTNAPRTRGRRPENWLRRQECEAGRSR